MTKSIHFALRVPQRFAADFDATILTQARLKSVDINYSKRDTGGAHAGFILFVLHLIGEEQNVLNRVWTVLTSHAVDLIHQVSGGSIDL